MCCVCDGMCNHVGPHSYCAVHGAITRQGQWVWITDHQSGWECPRCHVIWAPTVAQCNCSITHRTTGNTMTTNGSAT